MLDDYKSDGRWKTSYDKWLGQHTGEESEPPTEQLSDVLDASS